MQGTLHFHTFAEKAPEHGQDIFYFRSRLGGFIEPKFATVKCFWVEYDNRGKLTGNSWSYDADKSELPDNCRLAAEREWVAGYEYRPAPDGVPGPYVPVCGFHLMQATYSYFTERELKFK